ncbi:hypothetical protein N7508_002229 [Penicillium antarcticum]|uniref:uncharacterized protein n=1 Tax=Penicillium antarcticum TaxID=416450 RepID=UPI00238FE759|nr:uncharacterized protein N7508_002229 [Penicillium antarcticum]KAJ5317721.1 hypothetical protein N7508_002229 [Penicillium antarcticum]
MTSIATSPSVSDPVNKPNDQFEELNSEKFYHHPVWAQRWYHPELTQEASAKWLQEPWFNNAANRRSRQFLAQRSPRYFPWGFIIYRTVYTPESEELWPIVMERMAHQLKRGIRGELDHPRELDGDETRPEQLIEESHKDVIISDPNRWGSASIEQIRGHFAKYLRKIKHEDCSEKSRFASCLVIDERSLKSIAKGERNGFVGVVDARYNPEERYDKASYRGFMRVQIKALWELYINYDWDTMSALCPNYSDGWIPVYNGCYGTVQDEDGNEYPENYALKRPQALAGRGRG